MKLKHASYKTVKKSDDLEKEIKYWKITAEGYIKAINEQQLELEKGKIEYYNEMKQKKDKKSKKWLKENEHTGKNTFELWLKSDKAKQTMDNVLNFKHISYNDLK